MQRGIGEEIVNRLADFDKPWARFSVSGVEKNCSSRDYQILMGNVE